MATKNAPTVRRVRTVPVLAWGTCLVILLKIPILGRKRWCSLQGRVGFLRMRGRFYYLEATEAGIDAIVSMDLG
jgi:hypothetical protein